MGVENQIIGAEQSGYTNHCCCYIEKQKNNNIQQQKIKG